MNFYRNNFAPDFEQFVHSWKKLNPEPLTFNTRLRNFFSEWRLLPKSEPAATETLSRKVPRSGDCKQLFQELRPAIEKYKRTGNYIDIWGVTGINRDELRNSRVLAWLLQHDGSHGQGKGLLCDLLSEMIERSKLSNKLPKPEQIDMPYRSQAESWTDSKNRVDIEINGRNFLLIAEVKIDAPEGTNQILRYLIQAKRLASNRPWAVLYLTTTGRRLRGDNNTKHDDDIQDHLVELSWSDLAGIIQTYIWREKTAIRGTSAYHLLNTLADHFYTLK